ncbi:MAG: chemotaxis protein [Burkholderiaceae bacterium]|nr:chemotaxis protein [Burkholderiaceae bacterium]
MKNIKIGTRLGLGFAVVLLIMVGMAIFGINRLAVVNNASTDMAENRIPKLMQVQQIQDQLNVMSRSVRKNCSCLRGAQGYCRNL